MIDPPEPMRTGCIVYEHHEPHPHAERGQALRDLRVHVEGWTGRELSARCGIHWIDINNAEAGKAGTLPIIEALEKWWSER